MLATVGQQMTHAYPSVNQFFFKLGRLLNYTEWIFPVAQQVGEMCVRGMVSASAAAANVRVIRKDNIAKTAR